MLKDPELRAEIEKEFNSFISLEKFMALAEIYTTKRRPSEFGVCLCRCISRSLHNVCTWRMYVPRLVYTEIA